MARVLLALLLLTAGAALAREPEPLESLRSCAELLDSKVDVGYERVAARCPDLTARLEASPAAPWLPPNWKYPHNGLNDAGLRLLHSVLLHEDAAVPGPLVLHPERVGAVLERVSRPEHAPEGWWGRFKRWLRELFAPQPERGNDWLRRLFGDLSLDEATLRVIAALSIALLVVLAVAVVVNELRIAGLLRPRAQRGRAASGSGRAGDPGFAALERAEPAAQPALLLELIAARLAAQDRLPPARAFTVRELLRGARLRDDSERQRLADLGEVSERLRYADGGVAASALEAALRGGRTLLAALEPPVAVEA